MKDKCLPIEPFCLDFAQGLSLCLHCESTESQRGCSRFTLLIHGLSGGVVCGLTGRLHWQEMWSLGPLHSREWNKTKQNKAQTKHFCNCLENRILKVMVEIGPTLGTAGSNGNYTAFLPEQMCALYCGALGWAPISFKSFLHIELCFDLRWKLI